MFEMWIVLTEMLLSVYSITDIKTHVIDIRLVFIYEVLEYMITKQIILCGMIPGIVLIIISYITRGKIGDGDGYIILGLGAIIGVEGIVEIMFISFFLAGIFGLIINILNKNIKLINVPLVPFLLFGFNIWLMAGL